MGYEQHDDAESGTRYLKGVSFVSTTWRPVELGKLLDGLLAPLRLPERVIEALDSLVETVQELGPMRAELTRVGEHVEPLGELLPALESLELSLGARVDSLGDVVGGLRTEQSRLNESTEELGRELAAIHKTISALRDDVEQISDRVPDTSAGPLEKARAVLTGNGH
jgi:predicted nuclease with TOPRIM domain